MKALFGIALIFICSCSALKPGCLVQNEGTKIVSNVLVKQLQCSNAAAVQSDVSSLFSKLDICPATPIQGPIADAVCPAVSTFVSNFLSTQVVPSTWGCTSVNAQAALQSAILKACQRIPLAPHK